MKKVAFMMLILGVLIVSNPATSAPILSVGDYDVLPGQVFPVSISISGITTEQINDFSFRLLIQANDLLLLPASPLGFVKGSAVPSTTGFGGLNIPANGANTIDFLGTADFFSPAPLGNGLLATINLALSGSANLGASWGLTFAALDFGQVVVSTDSGSVNAVPIPAAVWLLGSGVVGLVVLKRRKRA